MWYLNKKFLDVGEEVIIKGKSFFKEANNGIRKQGQKEFDNFFK